MLPPHFPQVEFPTSGIIQFPHKWYYPTNEFQQTALLEMGSKFDFGHLVPGSCGVAKGVSNALAQTARKFSTI